VASALLTLVSVLTMPEFPDSASGRLAAIDDAGGSAVLSSMTFTAAQVLLAVGAVAAAAIVHARRRRTAYAAAALLVLGCFGHSVYGGIALAQLEMAGDAGHRDVMAGLLTDIESGPAVAFMALGLLGTVLGFVVLAVGLWRSRSVPPWIPAALVGFVVVEFAFASLSDWASYASGLLYAAALLGIATAVQQSGIWTAASAAGSAPATEAAPISH
jgi:hypothetical protein